MKVQAATGGLRQSVAFLTPLGGAAVPTPAAVAWFGVVGAGLGLGLGGLWLVATELWPPAVAAAVVVTADLALTGLLHVDGLVDSADGLLPHLADPSAQRRLEMMAEPTVGAFGVAVAVAVLLLRWAALAALAPSALLLAALWCASRTAMAAAVTTLPYARPAGGLATAFRGGRRRSPLPGAALAIVMAAWWAPIAGPASVVAGALAGGAVLAGARRRIGGYTGDVLGAAGLVAETTGLLVAAGRW